ncbi:MAG TPA: hypothetical protein VIM76_06655 [Candidatus Dormibacteraeota bacterium]
MISESASSRPKTAATALRLVRNAALVCAGAAVVAAVVGVLVGHPGPGGALATGLAIGSINGAMAARLIALPIPFLATSLLRIITLSMIGIAIGLAFGLANIWLVILGLGVAQVVLAAAALRESLRLR